MKNLLIVTAATLLLPALALAQGTVESQTDAVESGVEEVPPRSTRSRGNVYVEEIELGLDYGDCQMGEIVTSFKPSDRVQHLKVVMNREGENTLVNIKWIAVDAGGEKNYVVVEKDFLLTAPNNTVHFQASLPRDWPVGRYRADVWVDGRRDRSIEFDIREDDVDSGPEGAD